MHSDHHHHMSMGTSMGFFCSTKTALFISTWVPRSSFQYFLALIFIFCLGIIYKILSAYKSYWEYQQRIKYKNQPQSINNADTNYPSTEYLEQPFESMLNKEKNKQNSPFQYQACFIRGSLQFFICFISYLLMIVVMTMNIGYFFTAIIGISIGEMILFRYSNYCSNSSCNIC
ncbi:hypothetical protein PCANB_000444 [Pneumocystis canis]|nr:hypothetical protein PCANB_000444 [Pneumocystis canis]